MVLTPFGDTENFVVGEGEAKYSSQLSGEAKKRPPKSMQEVSDTVMLSTLELKIAAQTARKVIATTNLLERSTVRRSNCPHAPK